MKTTTSKNGKSGLRPIQERVLKALLKGDKTRSDLYEALGFKAHSGLNHVLGKNDPAKRAAEDAKYYPSLITLGFVKLSAVNVEGHKERRYSITAPGRKALAKLAK